MKKLIYIGVFILFIIVLFVISCNVIYIKNTKIDQDGVTIKAIDNTITPTSATVLIKSEKVEYTYAWEYRYRLQKRVFCTWEEVPILEDEYIIIAISMALDENNEHEYTLRWQNKYGSLKKGTYRAVLYCDGKEFFSEPFKIN